MEELIRMYGFAMFLLIVLVIVEYALLMYSVYKLAQRYGKDATGWAVASFFISPLIAFIMLWCIGETKEKKEERIVEEELIKFRLKNELEKE